jgi:hypothetical protein
MASISLPRHILYEDVVDLADFLEATGRTISRTRWAEESIAWVADQQAQNMCGI